MGSVHERSNGFGAPISSRVLGLAGPLSSHLAALVHQPFRLAAARKLGGSYAGALRGLLRTGMLKAVDPALSLGRLSDDASTIRGA